MNLISNLSHDLLVKYSEIGTERTILHGLLHWQTSFTFIRAVLKQSSFSFETIVFNFQTVYAQFNERSFLEQRNGIFWSTKVFEKYT